MAAAAITTRRAFIGGAAAIVPAAAMPISTAQALSGTPIAGLFQEWLEADAAEQAACDRNDAACERYNEIKPIAPESLTFTKEDVQLKICVQGDIGSEAVANDVQRLRQHPRKQMIYVPATPADNLPEGAHTVGRLHPWPEAQARADEIIRAFDEHQAADAAARELSGFRATSEAYKSAIEALTSVRAKIVREPATCLPDLLLKAEVVVHCVGGIEEIERDIDHDLSRGRAHDTTVTLSIVRDLFSGQLQTTAQRSRAA